MFHATRERHGNTVYLMNVSQTFITSMALPLRVLLDTVLSLGGALLRDSTCAIFDAAQYEWLAVHGIGANMIGFRLRRPLNAAVLRDTTNVLLSRDSGRSWSMKGQLPFRVRVVTNSSGTIYCSGSGGYVRSSIGEGSNWQTLPGLDDFGSRIEPAGMTVARNGSIVMTVGGYRFQDSRIPDGSCVVILDVNATSWRPSSVSFRAVAKTVPSELIVCGDALVTAIAEVDASGTHHNFSMYSSTDSGDTWFERTTQPIATWSTVSISSDSRRRIVATYSVDARTTDRQSLPRMLSS